MSKTKPAQAFRNGINDGESNGYARACDKFLPLLEAKDREIARLQDILDRLLPPHQVPPKPKMPPNVMVSDFGTVRPMTEDDKQETDES